MKKIQSKTVAILAFLTLISTTMLPVQAQYHSYARYRQQHPVKAYFYRHPYQKKALVGAGIGAAAGAILAPEGARGAGLLKGSLLGGGAGLGYEYLKRKGIF